ncbi:hypothetical protein CNMCM5623_009968 [Aspergillus felis]|uniref:Zn(2)-C6 fungal-type domain-containing protein n=1 Tax=Aspergillus felis TaxID=1287682 RepID=A0A8H6Q4S4_9EURO|nr:hypothetical protein CNMCM5623_009968 [Aspergillus felis]
MWKWVWIFFGAEQREVGIPSSASEFHVALSGPRGTTYCTNLNYLFHGPKVSFNIDVIANLKSVMKNRKQPQPRKKACQGCTAAKVRCDLEKPSCSRCRARGKHCRYSWGSDGQDLGGPATLADRVSLDESLSFQPILTGDSTAFATAGFLSPVSGQTSEILPTGPESGATPTVDTGLDFNNIDLLPMTDAEEIRDRWLQTYLYSATEEVPKLFSLFTVQFVTCVLRSYPCRLIEDNGLPPFIHPLQLSNKPIPGTMANCISLVRMWMNRVAGSEEMILSTVKQEMETISRGDAISDLEILCAFQAYLIYLITAYFFPIGNTSLVDDSSLITMHDLAFRTAKAGFTCKAELSHVAPTWESWIIASSKRRTLLTMYLFTNVYNFGKGIPNFLSKELGNILAPESKVLWEASDRLSWTKEYNRYLSNWQNGMLQISELWRSPETGSEAKRKRIERWLQATDEFGMMLFAVCAHIHGC